MALSESGCFPDDSMYLSICGTIGSGRAVKTLSALMSKHNFLVYQVNEQDTTNYLCECTHTCSEDSQH